MRTTAIKKTASRYISIMLAFVFALTLVLSFEGLKANAVKAGTVVYALTYVRETQGATPNYVNPYYDRAGAATVTFFFTTEVARSNARTAIIEAEWRAIREASGWANDTANRNAWNARATAATMLTTSSIGVTIVDGTGATGNLTPVGEQHTITAASAVAGGTALKNNVRIVSASGGGYFANEIVAVGEAVSGNVVDGRGNVWSTGSGVTPPIGTVWVLQVSGWYASTTHHSWWADGHEAVAHSFTNPSTPNTCVVCGYVRSTTVAGWRHDANQHWQVDAFGIEIIGTRGNHNWSSTASNANARCTTCNRNRNNVGYYERTSTQHRWIAADGTVGSWQNHNWSSTGGIIGGIGGLYTGSSWCVTCDWNRNTGVGDYDYWLWLQQQQGANNNVPAVTNTVDMRVVIGGRAYSGPSGLINAMNANRGATLNVNMGEQTSIPASVLQTARTTGCTLQLSMRNGALWIIKGSDITAARTINLGITYNTRNIPAAAANRVSSGAISRAQLTIGDNVALGLSTSIGVKYNANRAGRTVTLYRFDTSRGQLVQVSRTTISSTGHARFTGINQGGDFLTVISR